MLRVKCSSKQLIYLYVLKIENFMSMEWDEL